MKKLLMMALLAMVSWALIGSPAQAAETSRQNLTLVKHRVVKHHNKKHKKSHRKHKKHKKG